MSDVQLISTKEEWFEFIKNPDTVTDFARRNGCVPCQRLEPHLATAAGKVEGVKFAKVYMDECDSDFTDYIMDALGVMGTPTLMRYKYGEFAGIVTGRSAPLLIKELSA